MADPIDAARSAPPERLDGEVCVIGGGAAGLYLAARLAELGRRTVLLEAGPWNPVEAAALGFDAAMVDQRYAGAYEGRRFGLGGTTAQWGGKLVLPSAACASGDGEAARGWAGLLATIETRAGAVLADLGLPEAPAEQAAGAIRCRRSWHLGFGERNARTAFGARLAAAERVVTVFNAPLVALDPVEGSAGIATARAAGPRGPLTVTARAIVIAAGAIETTRLLLETERRFGHSPLTGTAALGVGLGDHLSAPIARPAPSARDDVIASFAPEFRNGRMRSVSFLAPRGGPPAFAHWSFDDQGAGFAVAREAFAALQARRLPQIAPTRLLRGAGELATLGWARYVRNRLWIAPTASVGLSLDMAQPRRAANRIALGAARDRLDRPVAEIAWSVSDADAVAFAAAGEAFVAEWNRTPHLPTIIAQPREVDAVKPFDAYHPVGTTFAGAAGDGAVLDLGLKVHGMDNLYAASTAALPDAGDANPTFGLLCLVHALADRLAAELRP